MKSSKWSLMSHVLLQIYNEWEVMVLQAQVQVRRASQQREGWCHHCSSLPPFLPPTTGSLSRTTNPPPQSRTVNVFQKPNWDFWKMERQNQMWKLNCRTIFFSNRKDGEYQTGFTLISLDTTEDRAFSSHLCLLELCSDVSHFVKTPRDFFFTTCITGLTL